MINLILGVVLIIIGVLISAFAYVVVVSVFTGRGK